jgi:4-amino-4-deoxy-L-arabinose transferase-like glycosyltransferase
VRRFGQLPGVDKLLLWLYCGVLFFYGLNSGNFYRTEALRAIVAREFIRTGNWLVPTLYGEPLLTKPPLHYAAIALVSLPGGDVTEWSARLPSALAACATILIFYSWFGRELGRRAGFIAGMIVPSSVAWFDRVPSAEVDMLHVAWVVGSLYCGYRASECGAATDPRTARGHLWWIGALLCVAAGVLTKWTTPLFFYGTLLPFLWWRGRLRLLFCTAHLSAVAIAGAIVLIWLSAVLWYVGWDRLSAMFWQEAIPKFLPGQRPGGYPWAEAVLLPCRLLLANLPWSAFALLTLAPRLSECWSIREQRLLGFLHCWLWPSLLFWTVVPNHAPRHSFPLAPAIAGLATLVWIKLLGGQLRWPIGRFSAVQILTFLFTGFLIAKTCFTSLVPIERTRLRQPQKTGELLAQRVPPGATLYLFGVKDEGVMFYYGRPVCRFCDPTALPSQDELLYCIITESEWWQWRHVTRGELVHELHDEQGAKLLLVRMRYDSTCSTTPAREAPLAERQAVW